MVESSIQLSCKNRTIGSGEDQFEEVDSLVLQDFSRRKVPQTLV